MKKMRILIALCLVFVLAIPCVASAEENGSSFVTEPDGRSYQGLPDFPTYSTVVYGSLGTRYIKHTEYILYYSADESKYYLLCLSGQGGNIYLTSDNCLAYSGMYYRYTDSSLTSYDDTYNGSCYFEYSCPKGGTSWSRGMTTYSSVLSVAYKDKLLQSSATIYKDSSLNTVFTKPAEGPLMLGMSSAMVVKMMMKEIVGLVPLVIGFLICLMALWKGYQVLRRELLTV